jgi:RNA polymerase sigma factor (sigma-70 family)
VANSDSRKIEHGPRDTMSRRALDDAYRRWWKILRTSIARRFGAGPPDPEEAVQSAFEKYAKLDNQEAVADPLAYLYVAARNHVLDYRRHLAVRSAAAATIEAMEIGGGSSVLDAERVLIGRERLAIVEKTVREMDPRRREVMTLLIVHDLKSTEIARRIGISDTRVRQLVAQGMAACLAALNAGEEGG